MSLLPGPPGWCEETEALVLARLNRNDKRLLRLAPKLARCRVGHLFTELLIAEDEATGEVLQSVDLASFPNATSITVGCSGAMEKGWVERWTRFVA